MMSLEVLFKKSQNINATTNLSLQVNQGISPSLSLSPLDNLTRPRLLPERVGLLAGEADDQVVLHHVLESEPL